MINFEDTATAFQAKSSWDLRKSRFIFSTMNWPWMVKFGTAMTKAALFMKLPVKGLIKKTLFNQFCGGESIRDCRQAIATLGQYHVQTILDYSVEGQELEKSFDQTRDEALAVIEHAQSDPQIPFCVVKLTGLGSRELMTRVQNGESLSAQENEFFQSFKKRVDVIANQVSEKGLKFLIDAEESWIQKVIDDVAIGLMHKYNQNAPVVHNTYQLYRKDALEEMKAAHRQLVSAGCQMGVKLVRGAYMEKERERAEELGYPDPIQSHKVDTDRDFDNALKYVVEHLDTFSVCAGTHNEKSCLLLAELLADKKVEKSDNRVFFAQLLGMSDNISFTLASKGYNVAKYMPYGPVEKVMPYLFRRAEENTSVAGQSGRELTLVIKELKRRKAQRIHVKRTGAAAPQRT